MRNTVYIIDSQIVSVLLRRALTVKRILDVIHTVGPQGEKPDKLRECYKNSLLLAKENNLRTIAFPCISTGIYDYPQRPAAEVAISTVKRFLLDNKNSVRIYFKVNLYRAWIDRIRKKKERKIYLLIP